MEKIQISSLGFQSGLLKEKIVIVLVVNFVFGHCEVEAIWNPHFWRIIWVNTNIFPRGMKPKVNFSFIQIINYWNHPCHETIMENKSRYHILLTNSMFTNLPWCSQSINSLIYVYSIQILRLLDHSQNHTSLYYHHPKKISILLPAHIT